MNFFDFFGLTPKVEIDLPALKKAYHKKMMELHPDMNTSASEEDQSRALELSSMNNTAYNTLSDLHKRLAYIADEYGTELNQKTTMPQMFLMEMMDVNDEIMEMQFDFNQQKASALSSVLLAKEKDLEQQLLVRLENIDLKKGLGEEEQKIREFLATRNYLLRLQDNILKLNQA